MRAFFFQHRVNTNPPTFNIQHAKMNRPLISKDVPSDDPMEATATSLSAIVGHEVGREALLASICNEIERLMALSMAAV